MIMTKITFTSKDVYFDNFLEFEENILNHLGIEKFNEFIKGTIDFIINDKMYPVEKTHWEQLSGFIQRYHKDSLDAKEFQLFLVNNKIFIELYNKLKSQNIDVRVDMLAADENNLNSQSLYQIQLYDSFGGLVKWDNNGFASRD